METIVEPTLKDKIHFAISDIEDEKLLESIYTLINYSTKEKEIFECTDEHLQLLKDREAKYLSGESKAYTVEEFKAKFFEKYGI